MRKLKNQVKDNTKNILANAEYIKHVEDLLHEKEDQINKRIEEGETTLWKRIDEFDIELHRELDKRFDKVYQTLGELKSK